MTDQIERRAWKYEGVEQEDACYIDHEFSNGNLCKRYVVTLDKEINNWYGTIYTADDAEAPFDDEANMPPELLTELCAMIPANPQHIKRIGDMTQAKHTPGPWTFNNDNFDGVIRAKESTGPHTARYKNIAENVSHDNARLIAAAPELLNALMAAKDTLGALANDVDDFRMKFGDTPYYDHGEATYNFNETMALVDAAIAKAKGE